MAKLKNSLTGLLLSRLLCPSKWGTGCEKPRKPSWLEPEIAVGPGPRMALSRLRTRRESTHGRPAKYQKTKRNKILRSVPLPFQALQNKILSYLLMMETPMAGAAPAPAAAPAGVTPAAAGPPPAASANHSALR